MHGGTLSQPSPGDQGHSECGSNQKQIYSYSGKDIKNLNKAEAAVTLYKNNHCPQS